MISAAHRQGGRSAQSSITLLTWEAKRQEQCKILYNNQIKMGYDCMRILETFFRFALLYFDVLIKYFTQLEQVFSLYLP